MTPAVLTEADGRHPDHRCEQKPCPHIPSVTPQESADPREAVVAALDGPWFAMVEDIIGLWGTGTPDKDDVLDVVSEARVHIRAALAAAPLPSDTPAETHIPGCRGFIGDDGGRYDCICPDTPADGLDARLVIEADLVLALKNILYDAAETGVIGARVMRDTLFPTAAALTQEPRP